MNARLLVAGSGVGALVLPWPALDPVGVALTLVGLVAVFLATQQPGSAAPAVVIAAATASWLVTGPHHPALLCAFAVTVSVHHSAAGYAACVPAGARDRRLARHWAARAAATTAAGLVVGLAATVLPQLPGGGLPVAAGAIATLLLAAAPLLLLRRRTHSDSPADAGSGSG